SKCSKDFKTADVRHHQVKQHQVGRLAAEQVQPFARVGSRDEVFVTFDLKQPLDDLGVHRLVVDHDDAGVGHGAVADRLEVRGGRTGGSCSGHVRVDTSGRGAK